MKTIIVYYSNTHNNEILAHDLQKKLSCDILKIEEVGKRTGLTTLLDLLFDRTPKLKAHAFSLELFSNFIFVAPIWAGKIASPLKAFMLAEKKHIKRYSFITLCGGVKGQNNKIKKQLAAVSESEPIAVKELWINDLLVSEKKNTVKYTSGYRALPTDLENFREKIDAFLRVQFIHPSEETYKLI